MKLGFLTACMPRRSLAEVCAWARSNDFEALEVAAWPDLGDRPFTATHLWVTSSVTPSYSARCRASSMRSAVATPTSRPAKGSSSSSTAGRWRAPARSPPAGAWPPDSSRGRRSARSPMPKRSSHSSAVAPARARDTPRERGPKATLSRALRWGNSDWSWKTNPTLRSRTGAAGPGPEGHHHPAPGADQAGQHAQQRRLAGAVGPDHADHAPRRRGHGGGDPTGHVDSAETLAEGGHGAAASGRAAPPGRQRDDEQDQAERPGHGRVALERGVDQRRHRLGGAGIVAGEGDRRAELAERARPGQHRARHQARAAPAAASPAGRSSTGRRPGSRPRRRTARRSRAARPPRRARRTASRRRCGRAPPPWS